MARAKRFVTRKGALTAVSALMSAGSLAACGGSGSAPPPPPPASVTVSGKVTFDLVPFTSASQTQGGLDFDATRQEPARGVTVQLLDSAGAVLETDVTDTSGDYSFSTSSNTNVQVRVRAEMEKSAASSWDVRVLDNTSGNAIYVLDGSLTSSGTANSTRNLNAGSGWGGSSYTGTRAAAPFAILDSVYEALIDFEDVDTNLTFPAVQVYWSVNNVAASGDVSNGEIGTSSYTRISNVPTLLILGDENSDTDEYDDHVIVHEWGHFFEDQISRADSVGGPHGRGDRLDPRVAFSEGWGNALSGMILDDPFYRDSSGSQQASGFGFSVDANNNINPGYFSEGSVQSILFDIYDTDDDGADTISAGLGPIYEALTATSYTDRALLTTIFLFADQISGSTGVPSADLTALLSAQSIDGTGPDGTGETNTAGLADGTALPVYKTLTIGGPSVEICSVDDFDVFNKLGNREFLRFSVASSQRLTFNMAKTTDAGNATNRDPDFRILERGNVIEQGFSGAVDAETLTFTIPAGSYVIEAFDFNNVGSTGVTPGDACYDFSIQ